MRLAIALILLAVGCGAEDGAAQRQGISQVCEPGKSAACVGPAGCTGGQVCAEDGKGWGECVCYPNSDSGDAPHDAASTGCIGNCWGTCVEPGPGMVSTEYCEGTCNGVKSPNQSGNAQCYGSCEGRAFNCLGECRGSCQP